MADHSIPSLLRSTLAAGDLIYRAASSTWARLAIGSTDDILSIASGLPSWKTLATLLANTMSNTRGALLRRGSSAWEAFTGSQGGILIRDANDATWLAKPSEGSILTHSGSTADPAWKAHRFLLATSDDTVSSTTPHDDAELQCAVTSGKTYGFRIQAKFSINSTSDLNFDFDLGAGSASSFFHDSFEANGTTISSKTRKNAAGTDTLIDYASSTDGTLFVWGFFVCSGSGTFKFRWFLNSGTNTATRYKGSHMEVWEAS